MCSACSFNDQQFGRNRVSPILTLTTLDSRLPVRHCSDDSFQHLKNALLERVKDKESSVRLQAVVALSKLQEADEDEEDEDDEKSVSEVLIDILNHDSAA